MTLALAFLIGTAAGIAIALLAIAVPQHRGPMRPLRTRPALADDHITRFRP